MFSTPFSQPTTHPRVIHTHRPPIASVLLRNVPKDPPASVATHHIIYQIQVLATPTENAPPPPAKQCICHCVRDMLLPRMTREESHKLFYTTWTLMNRRIKRHKLAQKTLILFFDKRQEGTKIARGLGLCCLCFARSAFSHRRGNMKHTSEPRAW